ncbi:MAG: 3-oxoadipate enol-lactonase, partial [Vicinamibacterales bacterium]
PALVLSNSLGTDKSLWDRQIEPLVDRYRVLRYDTRGHGESDAPSGDYTIDRLGHDVLSLMNGVGVARADVCGISIGGMTALWLGANAPERVHRLVLANTAARIGSVELWTERMNVARTEGLEALADGAMGRWFTGAFRAAEPDTIARLRATMCRMRVAGYVCCCAALRDADLRGVASQVRAECLVVTGVHDVSTPHAAGMWLAEQIPASELLMLDAAHLTNVERAAEFSAAVDRFLS